MARYQQLVKKSTRSTITEEKGGGLVCLSRTFYPACRLILNRPVANDSVKNTLAL